jgi:2-keto-4-pentenoate hydratase/2-oxohepta-3-ene-1,7-dioic acid hydratase in catechol pathway
VKLATFSYQGRRSIGVVKADGIADLGGLGVPQTMEEFLTGGALAMDRARELVGTARTIPIADIRLHAPVGHPQKFLAIAANYQSHIDEVLANNSAYVPPTSQRWFAKLPSCINGPYDPILMPPESTQLDYEVELAIIIGRRCRRVPRRDAAAVIAGFTVCNDVSARDWQRRSPTVMLGKSFDTHGPLGPWLVTPDEIGDPHSLKLTCSVNGEVRQSGSTAEMIDDCYAQIEYLSTVCTLEAGDVIATGTPAGTGFGMKPPRLLQPGDVVRCEIERVGVIEAVVKRELVQ